MRDCVIKVLSEYNYMDEELYLRVSDIKDDISLKLINKDLDNLVDEVNILRVGLLQLMCLEEPYKDNFDSEGGLDIIKSFRNERWT